MYLNRVPSGIFLSMKVLDEAPAVLSLGKLCPCQRVFLLNGSMVTSHIRTVFGLFVTQRTSFLLWFQACQVRALDRNQLHGDLREKGESILLHLLHPQAKFRLENGKMQLTVTFLQCQCLSSVGDRSGQPDDETQANKIQNQIKRKPR